MAPIPRNVHPAHKGRRRARATTILKQIHGEECKASFVDAAAYHGGRTFSVAVVDDKKRLTNCASIRTNDAVIAELAIALAIIDTNNEVIYSD